MSERNRAVPAMDSWFHWGLSKCYGSNFAARRLRQKLKEVEYEAVKLLHRHEMTVRDVAEKVYCGMQDAIWFERNHLRLDDGIRHCHRALINYLNIRYKVKVRLAMKNQPE